LRNPTKEMLDAFQSAFYNELTAKKRKGPAEQSGLRAMLKAVDRAALAPSAAPGEPT
jgi:hypothetical protein